MASVLKHIGSVVREAAETVRKLPKRSRVSALIATHNLLSVALAAVLACVSGIRSARTYPFSLHLMDLDQGVAMLADKESSTYHAWRPVPIPAIVVNWLRYYLSWLSLLAYRLIPVDSKVAGTIHSIVRSRYCRAGAPLFFTLSRRLQIRGIGSRHVVRHLHAFQLPGNFARHLLDRVLRARGSDSAAISALTGRGDEGQEAYGSRSALAPAVVLDSIRQILAEFLKSSDFPEAPRPLNGRVFPTSLPKDYQGYTTTLVSKRAQTAKPTMPAYEDCPFDEQTLAQGQIFKYASRCWCRMPPHRGAISVALSLVFFDGQCSKPVIFDAVKQLLVGNVWRVDKHYFVDTSPDTPNTGIRRVWLHPTTVRLAARCAECVDVGLELMGLDSVAIRLLPVGAVISKDGAFDELLSAARAFWSLRVPGVLRDWNCGKLSSRTSRPATLARAFHGCVERPTNPNPNAASTSYSPADQEVVLAAIRKAMSQSVPGLSDNVKRRILSASLMPYRDAANVSLGTRLLIDFVLKLIEERLAISTIASYFGSIRMFVFRISENRSSFEDVREQTEWRSAAAEFLEDRLASVDIEVSAERSDYAAWNHLAQLLGVGARIHIKSDPAIASRAYAETASARELAQTEFVLETGPALTDYVRLLTLGNLAVLRAGGLRQSESFNLRIADVALDGTSMAVVNGGRGAVKSRAAQRVFRIGDEQQIQRVAALRATALVYVNNDSALLLSGPDDVDTESFATAIKALIVDALRLASGSDRIGMHCIRRSVLSSLVSDALHPGYDAPLRLRQALWRIAVFAGHADPLTTIRYYATSLDEVWRKWVDTVLAREDIVTLDPHFIAEIENVGHATLRQRRRRSAVRSATAAHRTREKQVSTLPCRDLSSLVLPNVACLPQSLTYNRPKASVEGVRYVAARACLSTDEAARCTPSLSPDRRSQIDECLIALQTYGLALRSPRWLHEQLTYATSLHALAYSISEIPWTPVQATAVLQMVRALHEPMQLRDALDLAILGNLREATRRHGIDIRIQIRRGDDTAIEDVISRGFALLPPRPKHHFRAGCRLIAVFLPLTTTPPGPDTSTKVPWKQSQRITFRVTSALIGMHWKHLVGMHHVH